MTVAGDQYYQQVLAGRPYMAGISPWFYTHVSKPLISQHNLYCADPLSQLVCTQLFQQELALPLGYPPHR